MGVYIFFLFLLKPWRSRETTITHIQATSPVLTPTTKSIQADQHFARYPSQRRRLTGPSAICLQKNSGS